MAGGPVQSSLGESPRFAQVDSALNNIGTTRAHYSIIGLILIGCLFDSFEQNAVGLVGPILRQQWGLTAADIGLLNTITFVSAAVGRAVSGLIADNYGRRTMLTINLLLFTLGASICALAPDFTVLGMGRAVVGFGLGGEIAVAVCMLAELCSAKFRGTAVGLINVGAGGMGNFLAPAFGLMVFSIFPGEDSWRWLFGCLVAPALLGAFYRRYVPETPRYLVSRGKIAEANAVLSRLAAGRLSGSVPQQDFVKDEGSASVSGNRAAPSSAIFRGVLGKRTLPMCIAIWMTYGAQISVLTLMPTILVGLGYTVSKSLLFTMVMQGGSLCGALAASALGFSFPRKRVLTIGAICACAMALAIGFVFKSIALIIACGAVFQFFVLLLNTTIWIFAPELYPTRVRGFGTSFILATGTVGGGLMPLVAGKLLDAFGLTGVFAMVGVLYVIFTIAVQSVPETFGTSPDDIPIPGDSVPAGMSTAPSA